MWISESRGEAETEDNVTRQRRLAERRDVIVRQDVLVEERVTTLQHFGDSDGLKFGVGGRHDTRVDLNCGRLEIPHRLENKVSWHAWVLYVCTRHVLYCMYFTGPCVQQRSAGRFATEIRSARCFF